MTHVWYETNTRLSTLQFIFMIKKVTNNLNSNKPTFSRKSHILVSPIKSYENTELLKDNILKDNRGKSGIYR